MLNSEVCGHAQHILAVLLDAFWVGADFERNGVQHSCHLVGQGSSSASQQDRWKQPFVQNAARAVDILLSGSVGTTAVIEERLVGLVAHNIDGLATP